MTQDDWNLDAVVCNRTLWVEIIELTQVGCQLNSLTINPLEVNRVFQIVLADFKLNPSVISGALAPRATAPSSFIPFLDLDAGHSSIGKFTNKSMDTSFERFPFAIDPLAFAIPVITVFVYTNKLQEICAIQCIIVRLDIALQGWIVCPCGVPQDTSNSSFSFVLMPPTLCHKTLHRWFRRSIFHRASISFYYC